MSTALVLSLASSADISINAVAFDSPSLDQVCVCLILHLRGGVLGVGLAVWVDVEVSLDALFFFSRFGVLGLGSWVLSWVLCLLVVVFALL